MSAIQYILNFLRCTPDIHYLRFEEITDQHRIVIIQSDFWDKRKYLTPDSMPQLPLPQLEGMPILYGKGKCHYLKHQIIIEADFIASTFFLLSRYEELFAHPNQKDSYGRMIGKESLLYQAQALQMPLIDRYAFFIQECLKKLGLEVPNYQPTSSIHLTHDVDTLAFYRSFRGSIGGIMRALVYPNHQLKYVLKSWFNSTKDTGFQFPWMIQQDSLLSKATVYYFLKGVKQAKGLDYPKYSKRLLKKFLKLLPETTQFGLHTSTQADKNNQLIAKEKQQVEEWLEKPITNNRWHFLHTTQLNSFSTLEKVGITDDFSMAYPDMPGFRMGTSRPFYWINPYTKQVTQLKIHPLLIMDVSLSNPEYLHLNESEAYQVCLQLIHEVEKYGGEINLLWHNNAFTPIQTASFNHKALYEQLLSYLNK